MNSNHPSESELFQFALGELNEARFEEVAAHIEKCKRCANVLTGGMPRLADGAKWDKLQACLDVGLQAVSLGHNDADQPTAMHAPIIEGPGSSVGHTNFCNSLAKAAWVWSTWPSKKSRSDALSR